MTSRRLARALALRGLSALARSIPSRAAPAIPERVLLVRPDHLGDVLLASPAFRLARLMLPKAHLAALVGPWSEAVAARSAALDRVLTCEFPAFTRRPKPDPAQPYRLLAETARWLRRERFDLAVSLRPDDWWSAALLALAGIPVRVGCDDPLARPFLTRAIAPLETHVAELNLRLVASATDAKPTTVDQARALGLEWRVCERERELANQLVTERGLGTAEQRQQPIATSAESSLQPDHPIRAGLPSALPDSRLPLIAIHPGSGGNVKLWASTGWIAVGRWLEERGYDVAVTGSAAEADLCRPIAAGIPGAVDLGGATSIGELAAFFERCRLVLGVDSGPLHLATAVGTPTVRLYGPSDPRRFGPYGDPARHLLVQSRWRCVPCHVLEYPPDTVAYHACVRTVTPEDVIRQIERVLE
ncbi:MAG: glycosyltransferase family 9 protein [Chloroflexi bacterium]|nr:glycosyltransferase family 9 protein [Chloroflexota bacterium]